MRLAAIVQTESLARAPLLRLLPVMGIDIVDAHEPAAKATVTICLCDDAGTAPQAGMACVRLRADTTALGQARLVIGAQNRAGAPGTACRLPPEGHLATVVAELAVAAALLQALDIDRGRRPGALLVDAAQVALHLIWPLVSGLSVGVRGTTMRAPAPDMYPFGIVPCADGLVGCYQAVPSEWPAFCRMMERDDLGQRYPTAEERRQRGAEIWSEVEAWFRARPLAHIVAAAQAHGLPFTAVQHLTGFGGSPYLQRRGIVTEAADGTAEPGAPFRVEIHPAAASPSPERERLRATLVAALPQARGPLEGLIAVEVTQHWAGPLLGRLLADQGALVIKCEPRTGDYWRTLGRVAGEPELSWTFEAVNLGKASIMVNLREESDRQAIGALVQATDVFIENVSPESRVRNRIDFESNRAHNARLIQVSLPAYECEGPLSGERGMGWSFEAASGYCDALGGARGPANSGFPYGDPVGAITGFLAVLGELVRRCGTPGAAATLIDCGQVAALAYTLLEVMRTGEEPAAPAALPDPFAAGELPPAWRIERVETTRGRLVDHPAGPIERSSPWPRRRAPELGEQGQLLRHLLGERS